MLNVVAVLVMLVLHNGTMFEHVRTLATNYFVLGIFVVMAFSANLVVTTIFTFFFVAVLQRIAIAALLVLSATTAYFSDNMGAVYDADLVSAVIGTNLRETEWLVDGALIQHVLLWGLLPAVVVALIPLKSRGWKKNGFVWLLVIFGAYAVALGAREVGRPEFKKFPRREVAAVTYALQPGAFISAVAQAMSDHVQTIGIPFTQIGLDARPGQTISRAEKPVVVFLVLGESDRAENHQINGYPRETNPMLSKLDIINMGKASSCATATRPSVRCLFSKFDHKEFTYAKFATHENLVDVIGHAGFMVDWFNNNWSPTGVGVAHRIKVETLYENLNHPACGQKECVDSIIFDPVTGVIEGTTQDKFVVLHLAGSHFPYADRYPAEFEFFKPACKLPIFTDCPQAEIINAYDNSILYNDYILGTVIKMLEDQDKIIPALLYVSDHGESLGENGLYAHSRPVSSAPPEQFSVPFFFWMSQPYKELFAVDATCIRQKANGPVSHDNVFHTVLGMLDIATVERDPKLDLTSGCYD
jgi:lipid A ethanolaminephosphotransferase